MLTFAEIEIALGPQSGDRNIAGYQVAQKYLEERGIDAELTDRLGIRVEFASRLYELSSRRPSQDDRLAIIFPYFKVEDEYSGYWAARLVAAARPKGFGALVEDKRGKMFCPPGEPPTAYLPRILDWSDVPTGARVYIHEAAIKAINGARLGFWSVGLNGVRGWSAMKHNKPLVDGLIDLPWRTKQLKPVIVFDSNVETNPDVLDARQRLAAKLMELFRVEAVALDVPAGVDAEGQRVEQGFDDYAVAVGDEEAQAFLNGAGVPIEISGYELALHQMNDKVCVVRNLSRIVEMDTGTQMTRAAFTDVNYAHVTIEDDEGVRRNFPKMWMADMRRQEVAKLEYAPGEDKLFGDCLNLWNGMGVQAVAGPVDRWLALLEAGVPNAELRKWLVQWFAYPLQKLGAKMTTYLLIYGPPGTGKNGLIKPLGRIYGSNAIVLSRERLASDFNAVYAQRQFVNIDELHGGSAADGVAIGNKIKMLTTAEKLIVNSKGSVEYEVVNHVNLVVTSNYSDAVKLDDGDRRACVVQFGSRDVVNVDVAYWNAYFDWADSDAGAGALYQHLLDVDMAGFDPNGKAPYTEWKEQVTDATRGAMEKFVRELWDDADSVLPALMRGAKVLTPEQLAIAYMPEETHRITPGLKNILGQRMQDCGFESVRVKIQGANRRIWLLDRTLSGNNDAIRDAYNQLTSITKSKF